MFLAERMEVQTFTKAEWEGMAVVQPERRDFLPPEGWSRQLDDVGRAVCVFIPPARESIRGAAAVRPVVRVKMGRCVVPRCVDPWAGAVVYIGQFA